MLSLGRFQAISVTFTSRVLVIRNVLNTEVLYVFLPILVTQKYQIRGVLIKTIIY